jgi:hypothetical protein
MNILFATIIIVSLGCMVGYFAAGKGIAEMNEYLKGVNDYGNSRTGKEVHRTDSTDNSEVCEDK